VTNSSRWIVQFLKSELRQFPFRSHALLAEVLDALFSAQILGNKDITEYFCPIYDHFDRFDAPVQLTARISPEPFITVFSSFSSLIEKVDPPLFGSLIGELLKSAPDLIEPYANYTAADAASSAVIAALLADDARAFANFSDREVEIVVARLFGPPTSPVKQQAAALAGAFSCFSLFPFRPSPELESAIVWGGNPDLFRKLSEVDFALPILYHRYRLCKLNGKDNPDLVPVAIESDNFNALHQLRSSGASLDRSLLKEALRKGDIEVAEFLMNNGCSCDGILECAIETGDARVLQMVMKSGKVDVNRPFKQPLRYPLHDAVRSGNVKIVFLLLTAPGITVDVFDADGDSPMDVAVALRDDDIKELLQHFCAR
jgi:hypothetical protein